VKLASPAFYALRDARTPVMVSILSMVVNVGLNLALVGPFGYRGLAVGTALAAVFNAGALVILLRRKLGGLDERRVAGALARILAASLVMGAAVLGIDAFVAPLVDVGGFTGKLLRVAIAIGGGVSHAGPRGPAAAGRRVHRRGRAGAREAAASRPPLALTAPARGADAAHGRPATGAVWYDSAPCAAIPTPSRSRSAPAR
jgi:hypothetical protein